MTPWTIAHQAPLSMGFSRQEYWTSLPFPYSGDLPNPGIKHGSPALQVDSLLLSHLGSPLFSLLLLLSHFSRVRLCATPDTAAHQAFPSLRFSRQEHWSELPFLSPGDPPNPGTELKSPVLQVDSLLLSHREEWL